MRNELTTLTQNLSLQPNDRFTGKIQLAVQREGGEVIKNAIVANIHEQCRALLTKTALDNVGALSALEAHLIKVAPYGMYRYKEIVDAYAIGAAQKILRW
ncbi:MAG: hypothetical protein ACYCX2_01370 [Christensenellales bacterium]